MLDACTEGWWVDPCWFGVQFHTKKVIDLFGVDEIIDSEYYCKIVQDCLINYNGSRVKKDWILHQEILSFRYEHTSNHTKCWLKASEVYSMNFSAKVFDLNIIENVKGMLACNLYSNDKEYNIALN